MIYGDSDEPRDDKELERRMLLAQMKEDESPAGATPPYSLDGDGKQPPKITGEPPSATQLPTEVATPLPSQPNVFQSNNPTVRGYVDAAISSYAPTVQGLGTEAERKQAVEGYLRSLVPEIQKRGGTVGDIKNEKIMIDGKWVDVLRDIEGAAAPQYLIEEGGGGNTPSALNALSLGNLGEFGAPGTSLPTDAGTYQDLMRRIQEILGEESIDKQALLTQMKR